MNPERLDALASLLPCDVIVRCYGDEPKRLRALYPVHPRGVYVRNPETLGGPDRGVGWPLDCAYPFDATEFAELRAAYERGDGSVRRIWCALRSLEVLADGR